MTESINGDHAPKNLSNAFAIVRREVRAIRRGIRRGRIAMPAGVSMERLPRSVCSLCSQVWDFATLPSGSLPTHGICKDCKKELANGFTAFVCVGKAPVWVRSPVLVDDGVSGKIVSVSAEDYETLKRKMNGDVSDS